MNDEQAAAYYTLIGSLVGHFVDMSEESACELAAFIIDAGYRQEAT